MVQTDPGVLEVITPSRIGGAEVYVTQLCLRLPALGVQPTLFCPRGRPFLDYARQHGLQPINWKTYGKLDPLTVIRLAKLARQTGSVCIHTHLSTASLLGSMASRLAKIRSVAHVHGLNSAFSYRFSDKIIAVSEAVKRHLSAQGLEKNVKVVYNGVDTDYFQPMDMELARVQSGLDPAAIIFGVFGRLSAEKGQTIAIDALKKVCSDGKVVKLLIVGDGLELPKLQELAAEHKLTQNVLFLPFMHDIRPFLAACDAVLVPSLKEGFGLSAVNAMAMGKPVIASDVGGLPEVVLDRQMGILFEPNVSEKLANAMQEIIDSPDIGVEMGKIGRLRAAEMFNMDNQMKLTANVLLDI